MFLLSGQFFINPTEGDEDNEVFLKCCMVLLAPEPSTQEKWRHVGEFQANHRLHRDSVSKIKRGNFTCGGALSPCDPAPPDAIWPCTGFSVMQEPRTGAVPYSLRWLRPLEAQPLPGKPFLCGQALMVLKCKGGVLTSGHGAVSEWKFSWAPAISTALSWEPLTASSTQAAASNPNYQKSHSL